MRIRVQFTEADADEASRQWGCNCGPGALAAILGKPLHAVRAACEASGFATRGYMSPTMMKAALASLGVHWHARTVDAFTLGGLAFPNHGLARIQWEGPWTNAGANPKWAYRFTHWVASWKRLGADVPVADAVLSQLSPVVFDINGGVMSLDDWESDVVPLITASIPRADGDWHVTHCWEVDP